MTAKTAPPKAPDKAQSKAPTRARTAEARRSAYLVLGMHRSGTSAVTQLLALAGAGLPANVMPGDEHNTQGYFEPWRIALFNDERLRAGGGAWDDVFGYPFRPLARREERPWLVRGEALFEAEYGQVRHPLLKDPRVTLLMPFWRTLFEDLGLGVRCVIPVRHPLAVAGSLARRDGFTPQKSVLLWAAYMLAAEAYSRDLPRVFVDYDRLLADWRGEVGRIEAAHGAGLPKLTDKAAAAIDRALSPQLRHNAGDGDLAALGWAGELAAEVFAAVAAAAAGQAADADALRRAGDRLERRREEIGALVSPITRDLDALRLELRETRARLEAEIAELRATWTRDVAGLDRELKTFYKALAKADAQLEAALREP
ncbi:MAG TPA: hypothetical protein VHV27_02495 [Phenylobacterium sp.]|jgi:hypothetical protein|nr:hypothetical protein [Phenylobacterium sp.]